MNRRCTVLGTDASGHLVVQSADYGWGTAPVARPMLGSSTTGLHSCPPIGGQVLVLHDGEHMTPVPAAAVTAADLLGTPSRLAPGETALFGSDGRAVSYLKADGTTVLWSKPGQPSITVDAHGNLCIGGSVSVQGALGSAAGGGPARAQQTIARRRAQSVQVITQASNSAANTWYYSADMYVDAFSEMVLIASLNGASSGTPATFQMKLQIGDGYTSLLGSGFIDHPAGAITVASPQITTGAFAIAQYTNFASLVRVGVQWATAWTSATNVVVLMHLKS